MLRKNTCIRVKSENSTFVHIQYEGNQHGQRDRWSQVPWGVCEVPPLWCILSSHRMDSKLFQISSWLKQHPSNKFLDEKRSKIFVFFGSSKPSSHRLTCRSVSVDLDVHNFWKVGDSKKKWPNEQTFRHSKYYGVKFCFSTGESDGSLCSTLRSDQGDEKVQGHSGSAWSWSSTTCPIGVALSFESWLVDNAVFQETFSSLLLLLAEVPWQNAHLWSRHLKFPLWPGSQLHQADKWLNNSWSSIPILPSQTDHH